MAAAIFYIFLSIISNIVDRLSFNEIGSPYTDIIGLFLLPMIYSTLLPAQKAINHSLSDPKGLGNAQLTAANYVWIILGVILWALVLLGLVLMTLES